MGLLGWVFADLACHFGGGWTEISAGRHLVQQKVKHHPPLPPHPSLVQRFQGLKSQTKNENQNPKNYNPKLQRKKNQNLEINTQTLKDQHPEPQT